MPEQKDQHKLNHNLIIATTKNNITLMKAFLERGADIEARDEDGYTPLINAVLSNNTETLKLLISRGADLEAKTSSLPDYSRLFTNNPELLSNFSKELGVPYEKEDAGSNIEVTNEKGETAIIIAAQNQNIEILKILIDAGSNIEAINEEGETAIIIAAQNQNIEILKILIDAGSNIEAINEEGETATMIAARNRNIEILKILIDAGSNIEATNEEGETATMIATGHKNRENLEILIDAGADLTIKNYDGSTALDIADDCNYDYIYHLLKEASNNDSKGISRNAKKDWDKNRSAEENNPEKHHSSKLLKSGAEEPLKEYPSQEKLKKLNFNLLQAAELNNANLIKPFIKKGANIETKDQYGRTPLILAADNGNGANESLALLLEMNANIEAKGSDGQTPLIIATIDNNIAAMTLLLNMGANTDTRDSNGHTSLINAVIQHREEATKLLLEKGASPEIEDETGATPLTIAAQLNKTNIITILLDHNANIGITTLITAIRYNSEKALKLLIEKGANVDTALIIAAANNVPNIVALFLDRNANTETRDSNGCTALICAAKKNDEESLKLLIKGGADIEAKDEDDRTALMIAAEKNNIKVMDLLLQNGALINSRDEDGRTPFITAAEYSRIEAMDLLLKNGANIEEKDYDNGTALFNSVMTGETESIIFLVEKEADLECKNNDGETVLIISSQHNDLIVVKTLIAGGAKITATNNEGLTALDIIKSKLSKKEFTTPTCQSELETIKELLVTEGEINKNSDQNLITATIKGDLKSVIRFIKVGANIEATNEEGETALTIAEKNGLKEIYDLLYKEFEEIYPILAANNDLDALSNNASSAIFLATKVDYHDIIVDYLLSYAADNIYYNERNNTAISEHFLHKLDNIIESNNENCSNLKAAFEQFLNDVAKSTDPDQPITDYQITSTILDVFSEDSRHLEWAEKIAESLDQKLSIREISNIIKTAQPKDNYEIPTAETYKSGHYRDREDKAKTHLWEKSKQLATEILQTESNTPSFQPSINRATTLPNNGQLSNQQNQTHK